MDQPRSPETRWRLDGSAYLDAARDLVTQHCGPVAETEILHTWGPTVVIAARLTDGGGVVVKASGRQDVAAEADACELAATAGVLAPPVLARGQDDRMPSQHWYIMERLTGSPWNALPADPERDALVLDQLAEQFALLHALGLPGAGPLGTAHSGGWASWPEWLRDTFTADVDTLTAADPAAAGLREPADAAIAAVAPVLARRSGALVHGDLGDGEVFVDPVTGRITGLADWGSALVADPWYDFARFVAGGPVDDPRVPRLLPGLRDRYAERTGTEWNKNLIDLYDAHNAVNNAVWAHNEGVDWVPSLLAKAERLLRGVAGN